MKALISLISILSVTAVGLGGDTPKQVTKSSNKMSLNVESEIKAFYLQLTKSDDDIQKQIESLTAKEKELHGGIYRVSNPHVVEWFPSESTWDVNTGHSDRTARFLVIQPVGYGRSKWAGFNTALVAEFEITKENKAGEHTEGSPGRFISSTLTITFLGFRAPKLSPAENPK